jgi:hypothetical protein
VTCDEVRDVLPEHVLGTLELDLDERVRTHLRGCAGCRAEMTSLGEGLGSFARASHDREPPADLHDRVLAVLEDEWDSAPTDLGPRRRRRRPLIAIGVAAAIVAALAWAGAATVQLRHAQADADKYAAFLDVLGGENVRVAALHSDDSQSLHGSVVIYDSNVGQSWVLVLCRAPGWEGSANVTLASDTGETIDLHPMEFGDGGEGSTWLVTSENLKPFETVNVWDDRGTLATATVEHE